MSVQLLSDRKIADHPKDHCEYEYRGKVYANAPYCSTPDTYISGYQGFMGNPIASGQSIYQPMMPTIYGKAFGVK